MGVKGPTAKTILTKSVADIEAGFWCQGDVVRSPEADSHMDNQEIPKGVKPMACAVGLLSLHGNYIDGKSIDGYVFVKYPDDHAPAGVLTALRALWEQLPKGRRRAWQRDDIDGMKDAVVSYNDSTSTKQVKAKEWFSRALASLDTGNSVATKKKLRRVHE